MASTLLFAFIASRALAVDDHVTLELTFSGDSSVASRALVTSTRLGTPEQRYRLLLDFNHSSTAINSCHRDKSRSFDVALRSNSSNGTDLLLLEEEEFMRPEPRDFFRAPVRDQCNGAHDMPQRFYDVCQGSDAGSGCVGIIGLSPLSSVWEMWTAFTLSLEALHLGRSNPFFHTPPPSAQSSSVSLDNEHDTYEDAASQTQNRVIVDCKRDYERGRVCEFDARIGGVAVSVDFHTHDSYIYLPHRLYSMYMSGVNLERLNGPQRLNFSHHEPDRRRSVLHFDEVGEFRRRLQDARDRAADRSLYYQNSLHKYTMSEWLPLVIEFEHDNHGALVLDNDLLVHSPSYSNSYAGAERLASEHFFGDAATSLLPTVLLKPHPTEPHSNRVSLGNGILRRYSLHVDVLRKRMLIEERIVVEHLTFLELFIGGTLVTFFLFSVVYSLEFLAPLALCIGRPCSCGYIESVNRQHRRVSTHSLREAAVFTIELVAAPIALGRLPVFVPYSTQSAFFYAWAWTTLVVNGACLLVNLLYSALSARGSRPASGAYCWRSFRIVLSRSSTSEQLALLTCFCLTVILRRDDLGTPLGVVVGVASIANNVRYFYQALLYRYALHVARRMRYLAPPPSSAWPDDSDNALWGAFVITVILTLNTLATTAFFATNVFWPEFNYSTWLVVAGVALSVAAGVWVVHQYAAAAMQK